MFFGYLYVYKHFMNIMSISRNHILVVFLNIRIMGMLQNGTLIGTTTRDQSGPESNDNEGILPRASELESYC